VRDHDVGKDLLSGEGDEQIGASLVSHDKSARLAHRHPADGVDITPECIGHGIMADSDLASLPVVAGKEVPTVLRQRSVFLCTTGMQTGVCCGMAASRGSSWQPDDNAHREG